MLVPVCLRIDKVAAGVSTCRLSCFGTVRAQSASTLLEPTVLGIVYKKLQQGFRLEGWVSLEVLLKLELTQHDAHVCEFALLL